MAQLYADYYADLDPTGLPDYIRGYGCLPRASPAHSVSDLMEVVDYKALGRDRVLQRLHERAPRSTTILWRSFHPTPLLGELCAFTELVAAVRSLQRSWPSWISSPRSSGNHLERMFSASLRSAQPTAAGRGVIVCDTRGRVLFCNDIARMLYAPFQQTAGSPNLIAEACFVGFTLSSPEILAESFNVGVSSREVTLDHGDRGGLIILEPPDGLDRRWSEPLKARFALTDREIEVLDRLIVGGSNREISQALFIAECTVKKHIQSISAKVGARTRTSIAHAVRQELGFTP